MDVSDDDENIDGDANNGKEKSATSRDGKRKRKRSKSRKKKPAKGDDNQNESLIQPSTVKEPSVHKINDGEDIPTPPASSGSTNRRSKRPRQPRNPEWFKANQLLQRSRSPRRNKPTHRLYVGINTDLRTKNSKLSAMSQKLLKMSKAASNHKIYEPKNIYEALRGQYKDEWMKAILDELASLEAIHFFR